MNSSIFLPPLFSFVFTLLGVLAMRKFFPRLGLMDRPHEYGLTRKPVPYSGGIIFVAVFLIASVFFIDISRPLLAVMIAAGILAFVNWFDDRRRLSPVLRLCVQFVVSFLVVLGGVKMQLVNNPFGNEIFLDRFSFEIFGQTIWILSAAVVVLWLMFMMNVMNWLDGIPGLASGISTIAQISLFILSIQKFNVTDQTAVITFSSVLAASTFAFLIFDFAPPKILMGDTGSMFLGFMLGVLSILSGGKLATALLIMGFPVLDAFFVIFRRMLRGQSPLKGDYSHFHHRLLHVGLSERGALIFNYSLCIIFAVIALSLHSTFEKFIAFAALFLVMAMIGIGLSLKKSAP